MENTDHGKIIYKSLKNSKKEFQKKFVNEKLKKKNYDQRK